MARVDRYSDPNGNITDRINESSIHERIHFHPILSTDRVTDSVYPVTVGFAGNGIWTEGASIRHKRCAKFALELVTAGNARFIQDGKEYLVEPGMMHILRPGCNSELAVGDRKFTHKRFVLLVGPHLESIREALNLGELDCLRIPSPSRLGLLMKKAMRLLHHRPDEYAFSLSLLAYEIMLIVSITAAGSSFPPPVNAVINHMNRNLGRTLSIQELCAVAGLSRPQLHRVFRESVADSPGKYFTKLRIRQAAVELCVSRHRSIGEVARMYGFEDQAYFSNVFRSTMGMSPGKFRRRPSP